MHLDWAGLLVPARGWVLVANLPYNVATPLVADLLDFVPAVERMLVMVQDEVARRLVASVARPPYGAVSVKVAYWAEAALVGTVPSSVFVPRPKVGSALVSIRRRPAPGVDPHLVAPEALFEIVRTGFAQRRKMLRRALAGLSVPAAVFAEAGIDDRSRAEELSVVDWGRLAAAIVAFRGAESQTQQQASASDHTNDGRTLTGAPAGPPMAGKPVASGWQASAKLTLSLRITGVRPDGYHLLDAEMVTVDLADTLFFSAGDGLEVELVKAAGAAMAKCRRTVPTSSLAALR